MTFIRRKVDDSIYTSVREELRFYSIHHNEDQTFGILVGEPKVQPLRALVLGIVDVFNLLLSRQLRPSLLTAFVPHDIIILDAIQQHNVEAANAEKNLITALI